MADIRVMATGLRGHFDVAARRGLTKFVGRQAELESFVAGQG